MIILLIYYLDLFMRIVREIINVLSGLILATSVKICKTHKIKSCILCGNSHLEFFVKSRQNPWKLLWRSLFLSVITDEKPASFLNLNSSLRAFEGFCSSCFFNTLCDFLDLQVNENKECS